MSFRNFDLRHGLLADLSRDSFPTRLSAWSNGLLPLDDEGTHFGFVFRGGSRLRTRWGAFDLVPGMFFSLPGGGSLEGGSGFLVSSRHHRGMFMLGGPVEERGRLRYIDGCTDTLLLAPPRLGEPCLNLLHIPPHTHQSEHTHPSLRAGVIVSGRGRCRTRREIVELRPGTAFLIPAGVHHCFNTDREPLRVIAYHPDSDFGPTDEDHPMVNRTHLAVSVR